jgi:hypothetical protein
MGLVSSNTPQSARATSVPALVTFCLLAIDVGMILGVFLLIAYKVTISTVMVGILSGIFGIENTLLTSAVTFWVGSSVGTKAAGDALVESNKVASAAVAQLAGATPAASTDQPTEPVPVVVKSSVADPVIVKDTVGIEAET